MNAVRFEKTGDIDVLQMQESDDPVASPEQVVVEVDFAGVNFIDIYQRMGLKPLSLPSGLGLEGAGTIVEVGSDATDRKVGDRVAWAGVLGSYATRVAVPATRTVIVPEGLDTKTAAATMLQGLTAHYLSHSTRALSSDDTALVYAAAGGVGRLLVQLAKRRGARVLACTSSEEKAAEVRALGADEIVFYRDVDIASKVKELTGGQGVDVVYDSIGKDTFHSSLDSLKPRGLMVLYGSASGEPDPIDLNILADKGSLYATRPSLANHTATPDEYSWRANSLFDLIIAGQLDVKIHDTYPLADAGRAHADLASGTTVGKLLLQP